MLDSVEAFHNRVNRYLKGKPKVPSKTLQELVLEKKILKIEKKEAMKLKDSLAKEELNEVKAPIVAGIK